MNEAIILAGGFGTRLRSVVSHVPKPMAPVAGKPFLCWLIDRLALQGYCHIVLATGYLHEKVEEYFHNQYNRVRIDYAREMSPLGTGGAIVNALQHCTEERITVLNGDTLFDIDHRWLADVAENNSGRLTIVTRRVDHAGRYGAVETDATGRITAFREKAPTANSQQPTANSQQPTANSQQPTANSQQPTANSGSGYINGGIYRMHRSLLHAYPIGTQFSFEKEVMQPLREPFYAYPSDAYFIDIGVPDDYSRAQTELPAL